MTITPSSSLWEWGKTFSLFPQCLGNVNPAYGKTNYSHKKMQICPILKKLDIGLIACSVMFLMTLSTPGVSQGAERMVTVPAKPEPVKIDLARTAVVVVDMQNAFASKGGMFDLVGQDISGAKSVIATNKQIITAARKAGIKVIYLLMSYAPDL